MTGLTWLVTGGSGFLGRPLLERLHTDRPGDRIVAIGRTISDDWPAVDYLAADLDDPDGLAAVISDVAPDRVVHLAGRTPPASADQLYRANVLGTLQLLDVLRTLNKPMHVVLVGSAAELGSVPSQCLPVAEDYRCRPVGAYGLSKWLATSAGLAASEPLSVVVARVFNPIGPGMPASQAFGRFAAELAQGEGRVLLQVGDLESRRDFVDSRDVANALVALADSGRAGEIYHVGTGQSHRVGEGLESLIKLSGREATIELDSKRPTGPGDSRAETRKIEADTGWKPLIPWEQSLRDLWQDALQRARRRD